MKYRQSRPARKPTAPAGSNPRLAIIRNNSYDSQFSFNLQQKALQWEKNQEKQWNKEYEEYVSHHEAADYNEEHPYQLVSEGQCDIGRSRHGRALLMQFAETNDMFVVLQIYADMQRNPIDQSGSTEGVPCPNTKKAMVDALNTLNQKEDWNFQIKFNDTVCVEYPLDWRKEMPTDATLKDENGDTCLVYMFYKYPFVENWGKNLMSPAYNKAKTEVCDRIIGLKCAYAIVDDGYSSILLVLNVPKLTNLGVFDRAPVMLCKLEPGYGSHLWWMLRALDNSKKHRVMLKKYMTYNHHLQFDR